MKASRRRKPDEWAAIHSKKSKKDSYSPQWGIIDSGLTFGARVKRAGKRYAGISPLTANLGVPVFPMLPAPSTELAIGSSVGLKDWGWGFGRTDFGDAPNFRGMLKRHGLLKYRVVRGDMELGGKMTHLTYEWSKPDGSLTLTTANNPLTGEFSLGTHVPPKVGYSSYLGISGDKDEVEALVDDIKGSAESLGEESPGYRRYL